MIATRTPLKGQPQERMTTQHSHSTQKPVRIASQSQPGAYQFSGSNGNDDLAYAICQRARWRCQICQMSHGSHVMREYGFSRVVLSVDTQARRPRALCQRCRLAATDEMPVVLPEHKKPVIGRVKLLKVV